MRSLLHMPVGAEEEQSLDMSLSLAGPAGRGQHSDYRAPRRARPSDNCHLVPVTWEKMSRLKPGLRYTPRYQLSSAYMCVHVCTCVYTCVCMCVRVCACMPTCRRKGPIGEQNRK